MNFSYSNFVQFFTLNGTTHDMNEIKIGDIKKPNNVIKLHEIIYYRLHSLLRRRSIILLCEDSFKFIFVIIIDRTQTCKKMVMRRSTRKIPSKRFVRNKFWPMHTNSSITAFCPSLWLKLFSFSSSTMIKCEHDVNFDAIPSENNRSQSHKKKWGETIEKCR